MAHLWEFDHPYDGADGAYEELPSFDELRKALASRPHDGSTVIYRWDWLGPHSPGASHDDPDALVIFGLSPRTSTAWSLSCPISKDQEDQVRDWLRGPDVLGRLAPIWAPVLDHVTLSAGTPQVSAKIDRRWGRVGLATRRGTRVHNMDAVAMFESCNAPIAVTVVDGIGNDEHGARTMQLLADAAVRIGVTRGALAGVLTAAALIEDEGAEDYSPDGVIVLAVGEPGMRTEFAWVEDSHVYGWDGTTLRRRSDPHTMGRYLRQNEEAEQVAVEHDNWIRMSLSTASPATVAVSEAPPDETVILVSDGLDDVPHAELEKVVRQHQANPQALADALVALPGPNADGYRDDASAAVLAP